MHEENKTLLQLLADCAAVCDHCYQACLEETDVAMMARCIELDRDCAEACRFAAGYVARGSEHIDIVLKLCAEVCTACAGECEKHEHDHCRVCADICRTCATACG